jgi:hypothetical protein
MIAGFFKRFQWKARRQRANESNCSADVMKESSYTILLQCLTLYWFL